MQGLEYNNRIRIGKVSKVISNVGPERNTLATTLEDLCQRGSENMRTQYTCNSLELLGVTYFLLRPPILICMRINLPFKIVPILTEKKKIVMKKSCIYILSRLKIFNTL